MYKRQTIDQEGHNCQDDGDHAAFVIATRQQIAEKPKDHAADAAVSYTHLDVYKRQVVVARTGPDALEIARTEHPGLILMDINLPRLDGLEVIRRIRSMEGYADLPIAVITALSDDNERVRAAGACLLYTSRCV